VTSPDRLRRHFIALWTEASQGCLGSYDKKQWMELEGCLDLLVADWARALTPDAVANARGRALQLVQLLSGMSGASDAAITEHWAELRRAIAS
jgi:hypothetical protein